MIYVNLNNKSRIVIPSDIFNSLLKFRQLGLEPEAGGIFVGKRLLNNSILIINFSEPQDNDVRSRFKFSKLLKTTRNLQMIILIKVQVL